MPNTFEALQGEYGRLWDRMEVRPEKLGAVQAIASRLSAHKARYQIVEQQTGVPWFVVAAWHNRESDADFGTQLAQGDPLHQVSTHVPAGRGPFNTWEESAFDALVSLKQLNAVRDWSPAMICFQTERYNGFGYRNNHPEVNSPYLWSFTNHYERGKYIADGQFSSEAVDKQCGAIPIMKQLMGVIQIDKPKGSVMDDKTKLALIREFTNPEPDIRMVLQVLGTNAPPALPPPIVLPKEPTVPVTPTTPIATTTIQAGSTAALIASLLGSMSGVIGMPAGPDASTTGLLIPLISLAAGAFGIPSPIVNLISGFFGQKK